MLPLCFAMLDSEDDEEKFEEFYKKYRQLAFYVCNDILHDYELAEDAVSETFLKFASMFYRIKDINAITTRHFVIIVAKHKAMKMYNKIKKSPESYEELEESEIPADINFEEKAIGRMECADIYQKVLLSLPKKYYDVMYMSVVLQLTPKEIAKMLDLNVKAVYKRMDRAKKIIKDKLSRLM